MKLSQLLKVMDKDDTVIVNTCKDVTIKNKCLYSGKARGIYRDSPLNKGHIRFLMAVGDAILVEISLAERSENENRKRD